MRSNSDSFFLAFFFSSRRRHTRWTGDWSSDVCSSDLLLGELAACFGEAGQTDRGLAAIEDVLKRCDERQERWYLPELIRIKGELMLRSEERRVGKQCRPQWSPDESKKYEQSRTRGLGR